MVSADSRQILEILDILDAGYVFVHHPPFPPPPPPFLVFLLLVLIPYSPSFSFSSLERYEDEYEEKHYYDA